SCQSLLCGRGIDAEEACDRRLEEAPLALDRLRPERVLADDSLQQLGVGEVPEDQKVEARGKVRDLFRFPDSLQAGHCASALRVQRTEHDVQRPLELASAIESCPLDQLRYVRMFREVVDEPINVSIDFFERAASALRQSRGDLREPPIEDCLVQIALVAEVVVEASLVA